MAAAGRRTRIKETSEELKLEIGTVKMPAVDSRFYSSVVPKYIIFFFYKVDNDNN